MSIERIHRETDVSVKVNNAGSLHGIYMAINYFLEQLYLHSLEIWVFTVFQGNRCDSHILI
jgi:hypothetical protein